ncbi:MAG: hypothetical protein JRM82_00120 [Nitrososphaerota archaeon]|nr:hypothetical protein [Nitrososphaerota archaeon]
MHPPTDGDTDLVSGRDLDILKVIEEEGLESFSFEGLKRRVGAHPETLSRALDRLEEKSIVERATDGYRLTPKGREHLMVRPAELAGERMTLLKTMLPPHLVPEQLSKVLKGKWFGNLRWLGFSQGDGELVMKWVTDDGRVQLDAKFTRSELTIEGRLLQGNNLATAVTAAHQLLAHISKSYARTGYGRVLLAEVLPPYFASN